MTRAYRRAAGVALLATACFASSAAVKAASTALRRTDLWTGGALFATVVFLATFNARKKIPFVPLLPASWWMQTHIYLGLFSAWLFVLHTGARLPRGNLEIGVWTLFIGVTFSGIAGLWLSRWAPARLTEHGENLIFERIPMLRAQVRADAQKLAIDSVAGANSSTIADFFEARLQAYFADVRHIPSHWIGSRRNLIILIEEINSLDRYLSAPEREIMGKITDLVRTKDNLDFQYSIQALLKGWLFVHIPLTYSLLLTGAVHGILAWSLS